MGDEQLRIVRGQKKAAVTVQLRTLERHIAVNKSPDVVEADLILATQAFGELGTAHDALAATFATETDISAGEVWFTKAHQEYVTKVKIAKQWLDLKSGRTGASGPNGNVTNTSTGNTGGDKNNTTLSQSDVMNLLTVPKTSLMVTQSNTRTLLPYLMKWLVLLMTRSSLLVYSTLPPVLLN